MDGVVTEPIVPDYDGAWIGALVPALLGRGPDDVLPAPVRGAAGVVLLVLDGLGWSMLDAHRDRLPHLAGLSGDAITSTCPSTTATALTSISTGATPVEHGIVGYRMRVGSDIIGVLSWKVGDKQADPAAAQTIPPFLGEAVPVVTRSEFAGSGFTVAHLRGARLLGWRTTAILVEHVRRTAGGGDRLVYAYYDGIDKVAHEHGLGGGWLAAELVATDRLVGELLDALPSGWALLVTADHGHVEVDRTGHRDLSAVAPLVGAIAGEGRHRALHARPGATADLLDAATEAYAAEAWVRSREQLLDEGWVGRGGTFATRSRIGDVVLAARAPVVYLDPGFKPEARLRSFHGSLTADEVLVPLLAGRP